MAKKLTNSQNDELVVWKYFIPQNVEWSKENKPDIDKFFSWSEKGMYKQEAENCKQYEEANRSYFHALVWGKKRAGLHVDLWEQAVLDSTTPYIEMVQGIPKQVMVYMSKCMFKGKDQRRIQKLWELENK